MKRLIKINVTQKLLDVDLYDYKQYIGQEEFTELYEWSDNEKDAIGEAMAYFLNITIYDSDSITLLETKETSVKIKREFNGGTFILNLSFTT